MTVGTEYSIDQSVNFVILAVAKENNYNTTYEFEYWTDATEEYEFFERTYYQWFVKPPKGQ